MVEYKEKHKKTDCPKCKSELKEEKIDFILKNLLNELIKINCENCKKEIIFEDIESHFSEKCEKINKIFICNLCKEEIFIEENDMEKINLHELTCKEILYKCEKCENLLKKFSTENHLGECKGKKYTCEKCDTEIYEKFSKMHEDFICKNFAIIKGIRDKIEN